MDTCHVQMAQVSDLVIGIALRLMLFRYKTWRNAYIALPNSLMIDRATCRRIRKHATVQSNGT